MTRDLSPPIESVVVPALTPDVRSRIESGLTFIESVCDDEGQFESFISTRPGFEPRQSAPSEIFSTMLILNSLGHGLPLSTQRAMLTRISKAFTSEGRVHFFSDPSLLPADVDCTALGVNVLLAHGQTLPVPGVDILDSIAENTHRNGVVQVYWTDEPNRSRRLDAVACLNVLRAFYRLGQGNRVLRTEAYVAEHLLSGRFLMGTRYYPSPEVFLLFLSELVTEYPAIRNRFFPALRDAVRRRLSVPPPLALDLACLVSASTKLGIAAEAALETLVALQRQDGAWPAAPCFCFGRARAYFGSEALTTAMAIHAVSGAAGRVVVPHSDRVVRPISFTA